MLPLKKVVTKAYANIYSRWITITGLHTQPEPIPLCPLSDKHSPRFTVHLDTIQLCTVARHISRIKAVFVDFLRNRQIYRISNRIPRHRNSERERIYNAFINRNGYCILDCINMIRNDRISDHLTRYAFHPCRAEHDKQDKNCDNDIR